MPLNRIPYVENSGDNTLRSDLNDKLKVSAQCFKFYVQPLPSNADASSKIKLVEDPRLDFGTNKILVATIKIPIQNVDVESKNNYCENLSYNPWQTLPVNQPLGALNRVRKVAVTASSIRRHFMTENDSIEPSDIKSFSDLK